MERALSFISAAVYIFLRDPQKTYDAGLRTTGFPRSAAHVRPGTLRCGAGESAIPAADCPVFGGDLNKFLLFSRGPE